MSDRILRRLLDQPLQAMAEWMGCTVEAMNSAHDEWHAALCAWLGIPSHSLACAAGEPHDGVLAGLEEAAVLHTQKFVCAAGVGVPT